MHTLAQQHQACVVALEHRFYGESRPTSDMSVESLRVLSSQQALADLARYGMCYACHACYACRAYHATVLLRSCGRSGGVALVHVKSTLLQTNTPALVCRCQSGCVHSDALCDVRDLTIRTCLARPLSLVVMCIPMAPDLWST